MMLSAQIQNFVNNLPENYLREKLLNDSKRVENLSLEACGIKIDFSKQLWDFKIVEQLIHDLNADGAIDRKISGMFRGEQINSSENRAVKHYLLRAAQGNYSDLDEAVALNERERFLSFAESVFVDPKIKNVVNIGIGGSDLGPRLVNRALSGAKKRVYFISNIDSSELTRVLKSINFKETVFVVVSKTFTTFETIHNAEHVKNEFLKQNSLSEFRNHFVAVSADIQKAKEFGISEDKIFGFWDWVGGRYSLASAAGISIAMSFGRVVFEEMLSGMNDFDLYFKETPLRENMAFWHALSWFYNLNYLNCKNIAVIGYASALQYFATYLQQLVMESNGKSVDVNNKLIETTASPVVFGEVGTNSQHSFFQMIHQGSDLIPVDFILVKPDLNIEADIALTANALAQASVLALGTDPDENVSPAKRMSGNRPSNLIMLNSLNPYSLGALISLYEASTIMQGFINNINSFDQWGVQLGKSVAANVIEGLQKKNAASFDYSTKAAMEYLT